MKKIAALTILVVMVSLISIFSFSCFSPGGKDAVVSGHPEWPPIMYRDGNSMNGAGIELVQRLANDLGFKIEAKYVGQWDEVQAKAKSGEVDILAAAYKTSERETYMLYSEAYAVDPIAVYVKKGADFNYARWSDLIGKKGVLTKADSYGQAFDDYIKDKLSTVRVNTVEEAFNMIKFGQADYFVYALYSGEKFLSEKRLTNEIEILPTYVGSEDFFLTISKKSPLTKYLPLINNNLKQYKADGTIESFIAKHRGKYVPMARIDGYNPKVPVKARVGGIVTVSVTFSNISDIPWKFIGGASVWNSDGVIVGDYEKTMESLLGPGKSSTMRWDHKVVAGSQWVQFGVWKDKPYTKGNLLDKDPSPSKELIIGE
jgi:polar amino acid transport system substrate-binding protein